jgi:hypothetical protein
VHAMQHNLFSINPTICGVQTVLSQFANFQVIEWEPFLTKDASFELRQFRSQFTLRLDKAPERLMQT